MATTKGFVCADEHGAICTHFKGCKLHTGGRTQTRIENTNDGKRPVIYGIEEDNTPCGSFDIAADIHSPRDEYIIKTLRQVFHG